jgi:sigma-B regulation protein RsbU (phosphoserine phosphatase)
LQKGDLLALFSDGITEAENAQSEQFEASRLTEVLLEHAHEGLDDIIAHVNDQVRQWVHDPDNQDDMTIVLARRT